MTHTTPEAGQGSSYLWVVLAACVGVAAVTYNTTAVMTALPAMKASLDLGVDTTQWVVNLYMLAAATSLAGLGHFADMFGMLRIFFVGLAAFAIGAIALVFADGAVLVLVGRGFQGVGAAGLMATSVAMISVAAPQEKRPAALGMFAAAMAFGFALGPMIGGLLTDSLSWRAIFALDLVSIVIAAIVCLVVARLKLVPPAMEAGTRIDYLGIALLLVALGTFLYGLTSGQLTGWTSTQTLILFAVAAVAAIGFGLRELRVQCPLINFRFFRHAGYVASAAGMFSIGFALIGVLLYVNLFLQAMDGLGFTASKAGLALLPFTFAMLAVSLMAPRLIGPDALRWPVTVGMLALAVGYWLTRDPGTYADLWWKLAIVGAGVGLSQSLLPHVGLRALPDASAGQGSGVINTCFFAGLATGTAAGGVVVSHIRRGDIDPVVARFAPSASGVESLEVTLVHGSESQIAKALAKLSPDDAKTIEGTMQTVFDHAFSGVMTMMAVIGVIGAVLCFMLVRKRA